MILHYKQIRQRGGKMEKHGLWISPYDWRRSGALRERLRVNSNNMIPEETSQTLLS
jgi:hypothetical protein